MKQTAKIIMRNFKIKELGYDFMGYAPQLNESYSFHHLIIPKRKGGKCEYWNGAILCSETSHPYLHLIENRDYELFSYITNEMIEMNLKGHLDLENLRNIHNLLLQFEREHSSDTNSKGQLLIKQQYTNRPDLFI